MCKRGAGDLQEKKDVQWTLEGDSAGARVNLSTCLSNLASLSQVSFQSADNCVGIYVDFKMQNDN